MDIIKTIFGQLEKLKINGKLKEEDTKSLCLEFMSAKSRSMSNGLEIETIFLEKKQ